MKSEQRAILTQQVRRVKPSLAGMSYRLEPGEVVYITQWLGRSVRASEVSDPSQRISEDYFELDFGTFTLEPGQPSDAIGDMDRADNTDREHSSL